MNRINTDEEKYREGQDTGNIVVRTIAISLTIMMVLSGFSMMINPIQGTQDRVLSNASGEDVKFVSENEPNDKPDDAVRVYGGDVISGDFATSSDSCDYFKMYMDGNEWATLTLSHSPEEDLNLFVYEEGLDGGTLKRIENSTTYKPSEELTFQSENMTYYYLKVVPTFTYPGGGSYVLEIDTSYQTRYFSPQAGYYVKEEWYDSNDQLRRGQTASSVVHQAPSQGKNVPKLYPGDDWNYSMSEYYGQGTSVDGYMNYHCVGNETEEGFETFKIRIKGHLELTTSFSSQEIKYRGYRWHRRADMALVRENQTVMIYQDMGGGYKQNTTVVNDAKFTPPLEQFQFPLEVGSIWNQEVSMENTFSMEVKMETDTMPYSGNLSGTQTSMKIGPITNTFDINMNFKIMGKATVTVDGQDRETYKIRSFKGRPGNNDWDTPDLTLLGSQKDMEVRPGSSIGFTANVVGVNDFSETTDISVGADTDEVMTNVSVQKAEPGMPFTVGIATTPDISEGKHQVTVTASSEKKERSFTYHFRVVKDPSFMLVPIAGWEPLKYGEAGTANLEVGVLPIQGFDSEVSISVEKSSLFPSSDSISFEVLPSSIEPGETATINVSITERTDPWDYSFLVKGRSDSKTKECIMGISVTPQPVFDLEVGQSLVKVEQKTATTTLSMETSNGFSGSADIEYSVTPKVEGIDVETSGDISSGDSQDITLKFSDSVPEGTYQVTLTLKDKDDDSTHTQSFLVQNVGASGGDGSNDGSDSDGSGSDGSDDGSSDSSDEGAGEDSSSIDQGTLPSGLWLILPMLIIGAIVALVAVWFTTRDKRGAQEYEGVPRERGPQNQRNGRRGDTGNRRTSGDPKGENPRGSENQY